MKNIQTFLFLVSTLALSVFAQALDVTNGARHTLMLLDDGSLWGMGQNFDGRLGLKSENLNDADFSKPAPILAGRVEKVSAGGWHSSIIKDDGSLWVMGQYPVWETASEWSEAGWQRTENLWEPTMILSSGVIETSSGMASHGTSHRTYFVKEDGSLWGVGDFGENRSALEPFLIKHSGVSYVSAGANHILILDNNNLLWGKGQNSYGELADQSSGAGWQTDEFIQLSDEPITKAVAGDSVTFFIKEDGSLWGMGSNSYGKLGIEVSESSTTPIKISDDVIDVATGENHTLFLKTDGSLWGMGLNSSGQLGKGDYENSSNPVLIVSEGVASLSAGADFSSFVKNGDSLPWGMGYNLWGQLGNGREWVMIDGNWVNQMEKFSSPVQPSPPEPVLVNEIESIIVEIGHSLKLEADVLGASSFQWYFNNEPINNNNFYEGVTTSSLSINSYQDSISGVYKLSASNDFGSVRDSAFVITKPAVDLLVTSISDDFNGPRNADLWGSNDILNDGELTHSNGKLYYEASNPDEDGDVVRVLSKAAPLDIDWSVLVPLSVPQVDVTTGNEAWAWAGLAIVDSSDVSNKIFFEMEKGMYDNNGVREIEVSAEVGGIEDVYEKEINSPESLSFIHLRVSWIANEKLLSFDYSEDAVNWHNHSVLDFNVGQPLNSYANKQLDWNLSSSSSFAFALFAGTEYSAYSASPSIYFDSFTLSSGSFFPSTNFALIADEIDGGRDSVYLQTSNGPELIEGAGEFGFDIFLPNEPEFSAAELVLNGQTYDLTQDEAPLGFRTRYGYGRGEIHELYDIESYSDTDLSSFSVGAEFIFSLSHNGNDYSFTHNVVAESALPSPPNLSINGDGNWTTDPTEGHEYLKLAPAQTCGG